MLETRKPYNKSSNSTEFDEDKIESLTGLSVSTWRNFSGLFNKENSSLNLILPDKFEFKGNYPNLEMKAGNEIIAVDFVFHLETDVIYVNLFELKDRAFIGKGIATAAFDTFLSCAEKFYFKYLECRASKDVIKGVQDNGFITWAKFGFTMKEQADKERYHRLLTENKFSEDTPLHLLLEDENGYNLWEGEQGFSWQAEFDVRPNSPNRDIWNAYKATKKLL